MYNFSESTHKYQYSVRRDNIKRYALDGPLLMHTMEVFNSPRVTISVDGDLRVRLIHEFQGSSANDHLCVEGYFAAISRVCFWSQIYTYIQNRYVIVRLVSVCSLHRAPLRSYSIATEASRSGSMDFIFGLPSVLVHQLCEQILCETKSMIGDSRIERIMRVILSDLTPNC